MLTEVFAATGLVVIVKLAVVAPRATVTLVGTLAAALLLRRVTTLPPDGAGAFRLTCPVAEPLPVALGGLIVTALTANGITVSSTVFVTPPAVPEMTTEVLVLTSFVVIEKVAVLDPAGTVTLASTLAAPRLLLDRVTMVPPVGAGPLKVTIPLEVMLPTTAA